MFRILWVLCFLSLAIGAHSQAQPNPFDLKFRPPATRTIPKPVTSPTLKDSAATKIVSSTPQPQKNKKPDSLSITEGKSIIAPSDTNPFEVTKTPDISEPDESGIDTGKHDTAQLKAPVAHVAGKKTSKGVQIFFLLLSLLFLIFIVNVERSFVKDLWRVISNENYSSLHLRNQRNAMRQILLLMGYMVFVIQAGIFLYHLLAAFHYKGTILDNIWTCMALVAAVYVVRHAAISYLKWLFNNEKEMTLFGFDVSIFNIMVGLVLLPINVLLNFGPESIAKPLIFIGIITFFIAYMMRQLRWMLTARQLITNSLFLFFVYLCAVEILPLWAISKFFW